MLPDTFTDAAGRTLRLADEPGRKGGQATVYKAVLGGRAVAVKLYQSANASAENERRMLEDILRDDPTAGDWVVTVLGSGTVNGRPFMLLPWMQCSLGDWLPKHPLGLRVEALAMAAEAVARLHRSRRELTGYRVHRDIKPDNLLLGWEGRPVVRLADLGVAKDGGDIAHTANTGVLTHYFAPPEQALPVDQRPRESWDVHALAVTVFWGLTLRIPVPALDAPGLLNADGAELVTLARKAFHNALTPAEQTRFTMLRARAPEDLLDLHTAAGWREEDTAHLRRALEDAGRDPEAGAALLATMVAALSGALEPDPRRRDNDVRRILSALRSWSAAFPGTTLSPALEDATGGASEPEPIPSPDPAAWPSATINLGAPSDASVGPTLRAAPERVGRAPMAAVGALLGGGVLLTIVGVVAIALLHFSSSEVGDPVPHGQPVASELPPAVAPGPPPPDAPAASAAQTPASVKGASALRPAPAPVPAEIALVEPVAAKPAPIEPAPVVEAPAAVAPAVEPVGVRVRACPAEGSTVSLDGGVPMSIGNLGSKLDVLPGAHHLEWSSGGRKYGAQVDVGARRAFCHDFTADRACGSCAD